MQRNGAADVIAAHRFDHNVSRSSIERTSWRLQVPLKGLVQCGGIVTVLAAPGDCQYGCHKVGGPRSDFFLSTHRVRVTSAVDGRVQWCAKNLSSSGKLSSSGNFRDGATLSMAVLHH